MFSAIFKSIFKRRDVSILLAFSLLPLVTPFFMANQNIDTMSTDGFTSSLFSFIVGALDTQYKLIIPTLIIAFIVSSVFRDEIDNGIMFLYKDINRNRIFKAKMNGLFLLYVIYLALSSFVGIITYYAVLIPKYGLQIRIMPSSMLDFEKNLIVLLTTIALNLITISLIAWIAICKKTLVAALYGVLFTLLSMVAPMLKTFRYVYPNSYAELIKELSFGKAFFIAAILSIVYLEITYLLAKNKFKKIEF
ncbi:hypothetical protein [Streptococcus equinus]|uniref:hypothetical protein n=1 Tax=Streptococcus equinus TaxID=1335 RepID=UPI003BF81307